MTTSPKRIATLDAAFPPRGPCGLCGHRDARHRLWDAMIGRWEAGEEIEEIADDYREPVESVKAVLRVRPYKR